MDINEWIAITTHDRSMDGKFCFGLRNGKVVCRPSQTRCHSDEALRRAGARGVLVFESVAEAQAHGYRPCKRCRPELENWRGSAGDLSLRAQHLIEEHFQEKFDLAKLAETLFVNKSYLCRVFKQETGQTLRSYQNAVRCERAKLWLTHSEYTVDYVATSVGYETSAHFCRVFKQLTGMTPMGYRNRYFDELERRARLLTDAKAADGDEAKPD